MRQGNRLRQDTPAPPDRAPPPWTQPPATPQDLKPNCRQGKKLSKKSGQFLMQMLEIRLPAKQIPDSNSNLF
jgi:hypothetical protein